MKRPALLALAAVAATAGVAAQQAVPAAAQAQRDWTQTIVATPEGGYRMGNPAAAMKLVEYGSLTCPHCAHFAAEGMPGVKAEVKSGRLSFEFRNFVRDPADLAGALLSRCATPGRYFALTDRMFATQEQWFGKLAALSDAQQQEIGALPEQQRLARYASLSGLDSLAAQGGVAKGAACLTDAAATQRLLDMRRVAVEQHGLTGTPMFMLNGKKLDGVYDWAALRPHLGLKG